ncbi:hypothetical protein IAQ61_001111 [Plenodomus lingam]|uniref:Similar to membrane associated DnaJ chaperone n=1 Tax=Leptosphaeria maculans (strain JN3 / isolate v23.1.3 / race Av1-4-5-6-7-8) TaxID=985895 RepID=E5A1W0_LEPMJ|nr:similar to membrane associated DnaJ chaperone [Plenodomus lingam JN3]KAH9880817.1 hypothetical protein IAQ61_001111 [Plenodomus lingam]CBX97677.1 similar to membrane associated DnaJ chaperone [Plenodomus lingam JN3]
MEISWDTFTPFLVWQFLIPLAAGWTQTILYSIFIRAGDPKPQSGSVRFANDRRKILLVIYAAYFAFTVYETDWNLQRSSNAYNTLGVPIDVDEGGINSRFRRLTIKYHPDKIGPNIDPDQANDFYIQLKNSRDIILDPVKRFAYDRFGPGIIGRCPRETCITAKDYLWHGLGEVLLIYVAVFLGLMMTNAAGFMRQGSYWRYLGVLAVATFEVSAVIRPDFPTFLSKYINPFLVSTKIRPPYLPFQVITIVKKTSVSLVQFLAFLAPLYHADPARPVSTAEDTVEARHKQLDRLTHFVTEANKDASRLLEMESIPYRDNEKAKSELREALKKYMVNNAVHQEKEVRNAMGQSMARRRAGVPHGAQGTK